MNRGIWLFLTFSQLFNNTLARALSLYDVTTESCYSREGLERDWSRIYPICQKFALWFYIDSILDPVS